MSLLKKAKSLTKNAVSSVNTNIKKRAHYLGIPAGKTPPKKVVFDDASLWAFLRLAQRDGLVSAKPGMSLGPLNSESDELLERQVLEQVVLTPQVIGFFDNDLLCEDVLTGPILESPDLIKARTPKTVNQVQALPIEMVAGILRSAKLHIPESEYYPRLQNAAKLEWEREKRSSEGKRFPELCDMIFKALDRDTLSDEEWMFYRRHRDVLSKAEPIVKAFRHAQKVISASSEYAAQGMVPYSNVQGTQLVLNPAYDDSTAENQNKLTLIRVVANDVGTLLPPQSLSGALKLANSPEAEALRWKSDEWLEKLASGEIESLASIREEIKKAIVSLEKTKRAKTIGSFVTYAAVPVSVAEMFTGSPGIVGGTLGLIGTVAAEVNRTTEQKYRWALFGRK